MEPVPPENSNPTPTSAPTNDANPPAETQAPLPKPEVVAHISDTDPQPVKSENPEEIKKRQEERRKIIEKEEEKIKGNHNLQ